MKFNVSSLSRNFAFLLLFTSAVSGSFAQQTLTKFTPWNKNGYVHLPGDYNSTGFKTYPLIVFFPGLGEADGDASRLLAYGPSKFIADGHKMEFTVNGVLEKPIVISVQPGLWPSADFMDQIMTEIFSRYRVDRNRVYLTGLSMGGQAINVYGMGQAAYAKKVTAMVSMHAVQVSATDMANVYGRNGGKWWGIEGINDWRGMQPIAQEMNKVATGSALYTLISSGAGTGHCCWNTFYDPNWKQNGESIYTWLLKQTRGASGGGVLPVNMNFYSADLLDNKVKLSWQTAGEVDNSHFTIEKSTNGTDFKVAGTVRGKGTYNFSSDYSFVDEAPSEGTNYYRLKQYDFDGNVKDHGTKTVSVRGVAGKTITAYPTHITQNSFTLHAGNAANIGQAYQLVDMSGRVLLSGKITQLSKTIEVVNLQKGMFILQIGNGKSIKLIKD